MYRLERKSDEIWLCGKVDSSCSAELEKEIFTKTEDLGKVVVSLEELEYITSAGLRVLLNLKKKKDSLVLMNASSEVYDIFRMTGFTDILPVYKKRRKLLVDGLDEIARGMMGVIYRLDEDTILKVYNQNIPVEYLYQGQETLRKLFINDVPCAIPFDIVDVDGGYGAVYELLHAKTLAQYICECPKEIENCAKKSAELLKSIHEKEMPDGILPDAKNQLFSWLDVVSVHLSKEDIEDYKDIIASYSDKKSFLHLDFHPKNAMISNGEIMMIDLDDACMGDPMIDIACLLMTLGPNTWTEGKIKKSIGLSRAEKEVYAKAFLEAYLGTNDEKLITELILKQRAITGLRVLYARTLRTLRAGTINDEMKRQIQEALDVVKEGLEYYRLTGKRGSC